MAAVIATANLGSCRARSCDLLYLHMRRTRIEKLTMCEECLS